MRSSEDSPVPELCRQSEFEIASRREFLRRLGAASAAAMLSGAPRVWATNSQVLHQPNASADACILLWMAGGMAGPETFDPKRYSPYEIGLEAKSILCTFPSIDTALDGVKISAGLENIAQVLDRGTLIRSHVLPDLGNILHSRHQYHWHTGYIPPQTVAAPHLGAWISKLLGPRNEAIPAFIDIGQRLEGIGEQEELKAFHTAGFLGGEHGPFLIPYPDQALESLQPPAGMTIGRFENRQRLYREFVQRDPRMRDASDYHQQSVVQALEGAYRLLHSPAKSAFDLSQEPKETYDRYNTGRFGLGCLLARRLVEQGARFIEVTTEYVPFESWDTHENGHTTAARMKQQIDAPVAQLILDLEARGLLDRTLVVLASEFSRDMIVEGVPGSTAPDQSRAPADQMQEMKQFGLHRHFTGASCLLMFGGGIRQAQVFGKTADERPLLAIENPVSVSDVHASMVSALGISPSAAFEVERRPFYITEDGKGQPVRALFG
jgi:hypothetical protein